MIKQYQTEGVWLKLSSDQALFLSQSLSWKLPLSSHFGLTVSFCVATLEPSLPLLNSSVTCFD